MLLLPRALPAKSDRIKINFSNPLGKINFLRGFLAYSLPIFHPFRRLSGSRSGIVSLSLQLSTLNKLIQNLIRSEDSTIFPLVSDRRRIVLVLNTPHADRLFLRNN